MVVIDNDAEEILLTCLTSAPKLRYFKVSMIKTTVFARELVRKITKTIMGFRTYVVTPVTLATGDSSRRWFDCFKSLFMSFLVHA